MTENNLDEFSPLVGKILRVDTERHKLPVYGRLIAVSEHFLTLQRRDGRLILLKRRAVVAVEPTVNQPAEAI